MSSTFSKRLCRIANFSVSHIFIICVFFSVSFLDLFSWMQFSQSIIFQTWVFSTIQLSIKMHNEAWSLRNRANRIVHIRLHFYNYWTDYEYFMLQFALHSSCCSSFDIFYITLNFCAWSSYKCKSLLNSRKHHKKWINLGEIIFYRCLTKKLNRKSLYQFYITSRNILRHQVKSQIVFTVIAFKLWKIKSVCNLILIMAFIKRAEKRQKKYSFYCDLWAIKCRLMRMHSQIRTSIQWMRETSTFLIANRYVNGHWIV